MWERIKYRSVSLILVTFCLLIGGCGRENLLEDLTQNQATEVVAFLSQNGIAAKSKRVESAGGGKNNANYHVDVKENQYSMAMVLLRENKLPRPEEMSFADTVSQKGILPNSRDIEALRVDRAKAAELEETLRVDPRIEMVRAVIKSTTPAAVTVLVRRKIDTVLTSEEILPIVLRAVPGTTPENASVVVVDASPVVQMNSVQGVNRKGISKTISVPLVPFLGIFMIPDGDSSALSLALLGVVLGVAILSGFLGYWFGFLQKTRRQLDEEAIAAELENELPKTPRLPRL